MDIEGFRKAGYEAVDAICDYYRTLEQRPVMAQVEPGFLRDALPTAAPEEGEQWGAIAKDYHDLILPGITHWQHPNFYGFFPCNATFEGALADLHAAAISNPGFNWAVSPSVTELELVTLDWVARMLGLSDAFLTTSERGGGIILNSASEVAITVAVAARERALSTMDSSLGRQAPVTAAKPGEIDGAAESNKAAQQQQPKANDTSAPTSTEALAADEVVKWRGGATSRLVMYGTTQTHSIGIKAAMVLGLAFRALDVYAKDGYNLRGEVLRRALQEDTAKGLVPFMLIASIGTTSSGAIDDLSEIEHVAADYPNLWVHVDSAYAGVCLALPEMREACHLDALNRRVDSFSTNLHKWGLVQFDCSPLHVRDRAALSNALTITPEFLRSKHGDGGSVLDLRNMQLSLGRRFRSLKVWFVLRSYGVKGFRQHLRSTMELSQHFNSLVEASGLPLNIVAPPRWALTVFRIEPTTSSVGDAAQRQAGLDQLNRRFWDRLQTRNDALLLTQTVLPEVGFCVRFVVGSPQTRREHVEYAFHVICECAREALSSTAP